MQIESIDSCTIKIVLSGQDMSRLEITYEQMDYQDPSTRRALLDLLRQAQLETGMDLSGSKLFVEAFPYQEDGCILYINLLGQQDSPAALHRSCSFDTPLIFLLETIDQVGQLCCRLQSGLSHLVVKSSLFYEEKGYWLLLYTYCRMEEALTAAAAEFGQYMGKGSVSAAVIREHSQEILADDAIEIMARILG